MTATPRVRQLLSEVRQAERHWQKRVELDDDRYTPWMPSDIAQFLVLLIEAMAEAPGDRFLEVGCGPGSKMMLARDLFGLDVYGFDRVGEYVAAAVSAGLECALSDAFEFGGYDRFDIVFFNRPCRDRQLEQELERHVWRKMRRGAVVICMNLESQPPPEKWLVITDDWESRRGVWLKL